MSRSFKLLPRISAYENVETPFLFGVAPKGRRRERVETLLEKARLRDRTSDEPAQLSGGRMQRVVIARALAMEPACWRTTRRAISSWAPP